MVERIHDRYEWLGGRTHPPAAAVDTRTPEALLTQGDQTLIGQVIEIRLGDGRADPIPLDPTFWQAGPW